MAEIGKGVTAGKLAINVQKRLTRAQEKVLQKLGKADETRDVVFEEMVANFNKQMGEGTKLQKDLKAYLAAVKTMHDASRRLQDCLADMYEPDWFGKEEMDALAEDTDTMWLDYHQSITDKSLQDMDMYLSQFPDIKARIAKRDRKLVDFDSARHHFTSLQKGKKKDEAKIAKPAALLEMAAPSWAQGLISAHQVAQTNLSYNQVKLWFITDNPLLTLKTVTQKGKESNVHHDAPCCRKGATAASKTEECAKSEGANHNESASSAPKRSAPPPGPPPSRPPPRMTPSPNQQQQNVSPFEDEPSVHDTNTDSTTTTLQEASWDSWQEQTATEVEQQYDDDQYQEEAQGGWDYSQSNTQSYSQPGWDEAETAVGEEGWIDDTDYEAQPYTEPNWDNDGANVEQGGWGDDQYTQSAVTNGSDGELPPGFLYKVKAVHDYAATDGDELELKMGDVVLVLAFDNPDEQDDGWLMGLKESHWFQKKDISAKGVFPENFTQRV
ncbi:myc box-dependent-interacting protein 1-like [Pundamilia nyererei]|uniref:Myc box-dependent-interacting protein 1 n=1 Tax=Pundamilia nyererei TaxID=303518 RepID=A0A9Y6JCU4_9CICH|nr:PREDICTED: myc box-dependent-interacting protein 1-like [Pundamilia nyererei]